MKLPTQCKDMGELRVEIDRLDRELVALLSQRVAYVERAAQLKRSENLPARINARIEEVVRNVRTLASERDLDPQLAEMLWRTIIEWSIGREEELLALDQGKLRP